MGVLCLHIQVQWIARYQGTQKATEISSMALLPVWVQVTATVVWMALVIIHLERAAVVVNTACLGRTREAILKTQGGATLDTHPTLEH